MRTLTDLTELHERDQRARAFVYWAKALALGGGVFEAVPIFQRLAGRSSHADLFVKTAVDSHSTATNPDLAFARLGRPFLDLVARQVVLGRLSGTVPLVPYLPSPVMSTTVLADFVAEARPMPAVRLDSDLVMMSPRNSASSWASRRSCCNRPILRRRRYSSGTCSVWCATAKTRRCWAARRR